MVVEDDPALRATTVDALTARHYRIAEAQQGAAAIELADTIGPDVVLLDLGLPDIDGLEVCRHLRMRLTCPIIIVTADTSADSMVRLLDAGADDYVAKPYATDVLLARVRVALRHRATTATVLDDSVVHCGDVPIDVAGRQADAGGNVVDRPPRQFELLVALARNPNRALTYAALGTAVWGFDAPDDPHKALRTAVSRLRRTLGIGPARPRIETEHHIGYRLVVPD